MAGGHESANNGLPVWGQALYIYVLYPLGEGALTRGMAAPSMGLIVGWRYGKHEIMPPTRGQCKV